ncbi:MAG: ribulose-phosphate 3-epimerase [Bacteroidales bacterium]|nr:ribulose-phosphate 3-epimerase [Bacteroidales bacterium]MCL2132855.1 ribulose-phosphate 3-epimerase [Bacteroidales bacterium]
MDRLLSVSMLSANFGRLDDSVDMVNESVADWFHLDIMDGVFVPNISFGIPVIQAIAKKAIKPLDVHLMIVDPDRYIEAFKEVGAHLLSIHYEACTHLHRSLHRIKALGMKAGVVLNPHTSVEVLSDIIQETDFVLLMSVNPGFGGQSFIENTYNKITRLKEMIVKAGSTTLIEIDGGVSQQNADRLYAAGADILVAGNAIFATGDPLQNIKQFKVQTLLQEQVASCLAMTTKQSTL